MQLTDTHCHIQAADYPLDIGEVEARAAQAGVTRLICVGYDVKSSEQAIEFVRNRPHVWASVGLHPHEAKAGESEYKKLAGILTADEGRRASGRVVAIGECGLDYFYAHSDKQDQEKALRFQIELALEHELPVIFHVRDAFDDFWPIFDSYQGVRGVLHSFTDMRTNLEKALQRNLYIGANGIMTFTKVQEQLDAIKAVPLQRLLLETDAPFLTPKPLRGRVNEPAHIGLIAKFLSDLRHESLQELADATTANALHLFSIS